MCVDHTYRLHEGVDDDRPAKLETLFAKIVGESFALERLHWVFAVGADVFNDRAPSDESPQIPREGSFSRFHDPDVEPCVPDGGPDLRLGTDDLFVAEQAPGIGFTVVGDSLRVEPVERLPEGVSLGENGSPGKARLEAVEDEFLKQAAVVVLGDAPFQVVVSAVEGVTLRSPRAGTLASHILISRLEFASRPAFRRNAACAAR